MILTLNDVSEVIKAREKEVFSWEMSVERRIRLYELNTIMDRLSYVQRTGKLPPPDAAP
jgi:hypothetical protein